jgi:hypothetical protein
LFLLKFWQIVIYFSARVYYTLFVYFSSLQFNMDIQFSSWFMLMNLRILFQRLTVFSYKTSYFKYIYIYKEAKVKIFNSFNNCLQDVLELTTTIDLITLFCILNILILNSPPVPSQNSISNRRSAWNLVK